MAIGSIERACTVVLHDDRISQDDVLCGTDVISKGKVGLLSAKGARPIYVLPSGHDVAKREISLHITLGKRFGYENRMSAVVTIPETAQEATANHVEFFFRDICLSRVDMWKMTRLLDGKVIYRNQEIKFLGSNTATARGIYIRGEDSDSAIVRQPMTKPIFRSGSARFTLLIQVSREMLEQWVGGDLMYEALIEGYLVDLFKRWDSLKMRHHVSVILFGREDRPAGAVETAAYGQDDFFHVICADKASSEWPSIIQILKCVFNSSRLPRQVSLAEKGNLLEAIHIAALDVVNDDTDPRLSNTGTSIIAITAGTGTFNNDHALLQHTTNLLLGNSIGVDVVALSPKPLHPVPLFRYKIGQTFEYALPHWADVSYWQASLDTPSRWLLAEPVDGVEDVSLPTLGGAKNKPLMPSTETCMSMFDEALFDDEVAMPQELEGRRTSNRSLRPRSATASVSWSKQDDRADAGSAAGESDGHSIISAPSSTLPRPKKDRAVHPLLQMGRRNVSLGPRGLTPMTGTVSTTTVSTEYASHGKDPQQSAFAPNEA